MNNVYSTKKPIAGLCLVCLACCTLILLFPDHIYIALCVILAVVLLFCILFRTDKAVMIATVFVAVVSTFSTYNAYVDGQKSAVEFAEKYSGRAHTFCATVIKCSVSEQATSFVISLDEIDDVKLDKAYKARAFTYSSNYVYAGDKILFTGHLETLNKTSDRAFDIAPNFKSQNIFLDFPEINIISSHKNDNPSVLKSIRNYVNKSIYKNLPINYDYTSAAVAKAFVLGDTSDIPSDVMNNYMRSGLTHVLSVSGMHISIIIMFFSVVLSKAVVNKKASSIFVLCICAFYVVISGLHISAIRAGLMTSTAALAVIFGKKTNSLTSLFFSAIVIMIFDPYTVFDISALLSFLSTFGIVCSLDEAGQNLSLIRTAVCMNVFAVTFTVPVVMFSFGKLSLVSVASTLVVSPFCSVGLVLVFLTVIVGLVPFADPLCRVLGIVCTSFIDFINYIAKLFSSFKYAYIECDESIVFTLGFAVLVIVLTLSVSQGNTLVNKITKYSVVLLSALVALCMLFVAINSSKLPYICYYHKNMSDTQLSIKTDKNSFLLVNKDNSICMDADKLSFDTFSGNNSLLVIPDENIDERVLSENIKKFSLHYGLEYVFVPDTKEGKLTGQKLVQNGINTFFFPDIYIGENLNVSLLINQNGTCIYAFGENEDTKIVFGDKYDETLFGNGAKVCAYLSENTKARFDTQNDKMPDCDVFYTRLEKGKTYNGIVNIYGQKSVVLKGSD